MIQLNSIVHCTDNSRAKDVRCIQLLQKEHPFGQSLCIFRGVVCSTQTAGQKVRKSDLVLCALVRPKKRGSLKFSKNSCILLNERFEPQRTRIFGPIVLPRACPKSKLGLFTKRLQSKQDLFLV